MFLISVHWVLTVFACLFCLMWCISFALSLYTLRVIRVFERTDPPPLPRWPRLSVVITACNDADTIEGAVNTLLRQDYPDIEIVLVNDRSTDGTGEIIERIARRDPRVQTVHVKRLPSGWIGKVHALHVGTQKASGEWLLYTDADVHFLQGTVRKALALVLSDRSDHLVLMPVPRTEFFWLEVIIQAFGSLYVLATRAALLGKPGSNAFVGAGAFNLVSRESLARTKGFSWLRMEVIDDVGLGLMLHRAGAKSSFAITLEGICLTWYPSVGAMFKGLEKNLFGIAAHYSIARMIGIVLFIWAYVLAPLAAIISFNIPYLFIAGVCAYLSLVGGALSIKIALRQRLLPLLFVQAGLALISLMLLRAGILCRLRGGIIWRGTRYPLAALRTGQRVKV